MTTRISVTVDSDNLALNKAIAASSTDSGYAVERANDGAVAQNSYWQGARNVYPSTLTIDLGRLQSVSKVVVKLPPAWGSRTQTFSILGSQDDITYTALVDSANYLFDPSQSNVVTITFAPSSARYVRLNFTANSGNYSAQVSEFEVYGSSRATVGAELSGVDKVNAGNSFDLTYGLRYVNDDIYAQDLTIRYDPAKVEFLSAESLKDGLAVVGQDVQAGRVRLIAASLGEGEGVNADGELLKLHWKMKTLSDAAETTIALTQATISNGMGTETQLESASHNIIISYVAGDLNGDGKIAIGDLAIAAKYYGAKESDADWNEARIADINGDGIIDIEDLAFIAAKILELR